VTAQLECLLDDVVVGKQEMIGAIDAVCSVAERIIGKLKEGGAAGGPPLLGAAVGNGPGTFPPTPAMKRFADSLARQKGIKPPPGYKDVDFDLPKISQRTRAHRYAATDSLWQQGGRSEAWRPLSLGWMVCRTWS
jgi:hypothetical protein